MSCQVAAAAEPKLIVFDSESRRRLQKGINIVADAVAVTLGPRGQYALLGRVHEWVVDGCVGFLHNCFPRQLAAIEFFPELIISTPEKRKRHSATASMALTLARHRASFIGTLLRVEHGHPLSNPLSSAPRMRSCLGSNPTRRGDDALIGYCAFPLQ
eukprot:350618-Chlamydomonas_euryale.AAC.8